MQLHLFRCRLLSFYRNFSTFGFDLAALRVSEPGNSAAAVIKRRPTHKTKTDDVALYLVKRETQHCVAAPASPAPVVQAP